VSRRKITVVGAGNVGETTAHIAAQRNLGDIVLIDIVKGMAEGKALDIAQSGGVYPFDSQITGTTDWSQTAGSDIAIITSGVPRKPGMSRDDLLATNAKIVKSATASRGGPLRVDEVLDLFAGFKIRYFFGRNRHSAAGLGIASLPRRTVADAEGSEPAQFDLLTALQ
jgi:hypothetical protein